MKKSIIRIEVNQSWRMARQESRKTPNKRNSRVTDTLREKASCVEVRSRRQIKEEERNMWRGNNHINNGRKLLELKKVMRP